MLSACKETIFTAINDYAYSQGMNKLYQNHKIDIQLPYQAMPYLHLQRSALDIIKSNNLCIELIFTIYTHFLNPAHNELFIYLFLESVCWNVTKFSTKQAMFFMQSLKNSTKFHGSLAINMHLMRPSLFEHMRAHTHTHTKYLF